ncbi:hypothetical protein VC83_01244 [Pseudogymnoascus destructans]|uniref:Cell cycle control protein n=2 Tax=Pseudogymnoascus destructans TaxID=655981 RepID=L8G728_PSED2|nr:uncharacterized protein VC83_01244 [Pseudogymnoascus destructans]ELR08468.1 hypothetical protein GMDG_00532 [Pseudogymnoascus destructans 20631-21]OAF62767.1 hypothetical protein VC83_01244 [Pseudogymnoascus destructans]
MDDGLDEFEKTLATEKRAREDEESKSKSRSDRHRHHHRSHHHKSRDDDSSERRHHRRSRDYNDDGHRHKRQHRDSSRDDERKRRHRDNSSPDEERKRRHRHEKTTDPKEDLPLPDEEIPQTDAPLGAAPAVKRDAWMTAPGALEVDYTQRGAKKEEKGTVEEKMEIKIHRNELNHQLKDVRLEEDEAVEPEEGEREVEYTFGDSGAQWRMTRLKAVYREVEEGKRTLEDVAVERLGGLREFDDAREEEVELERRKLYGKGYVGKEKPIGELFEERKAAMGVKRQREEKEAAEAARDLPQGRVMEEQQAQAPVVRVDQTQLNRMKAQLMKAKLKGSADVAKLEAEYNEAAAGLLARGPEVIVLGEMENRLLAGTRGEVVSIDNKRGRERGLVKSNEDMSIEDMVREERRTKYQAGGEGRKFAERIAKDTKFENNLDYLNDNTAKLAKSAPKSEMNLKNMAIGEFQKMNRILDACPLCHHEDRNQAPAAPIVSLGTRTFLTLPTTPEIADGGAVIVPIAHRTNLLECDDDEWDEIRNYMKSLTRMYHDQGRAVIFYENAAAPNRRPHAALQAVPLPYELGDTAPAFFREAILASDEEWTQHRKLIDTGKAAKGGMGRLAFRRTLAKEMPYFHVWFDLDGGLGHVVEDANRWPRGDLFAREVIGGMLDVEPDVVKRQGRWQRGGNVERMEGFQKRFRKFDWARVLTDGA